MKNINDTLSEVFDVESTDTGELVESCNCELVGSENDVLMSDVDRDAEYARENIKALIKTGIKAAESLLKIAENSQQPKEYEALSQMIKNVSEMNKDLLEIHKKKKDLDPNNYSKQNINVDKAVVFTGSTSELIKLIKQNKEE